MVPYGEPSAGKFSVGSFQIMMFEDWLCFRWKYSLSVVGVNFCLPVSSPDFLEHTAKDEGSSEGSDDCSPANAPIKY